MMWVKVQLFKNTHKAWEIQYTYTNVLFLEYNVSPVISFTISTFVDWDRLDIASLLCLFLWKSGSLFKIFVFSSLSVAGHLAESPVVFLITITFMDFSLACPSVLIVKRDCCNLCMAGSWVWDETIAIADACCLSWVFVVIQHKSRHRK